MRWSCPDLVAERSRSPFATLPPALSHSNASQQCNMSIEAGARAGMIAPDEITFKYLEGRPLCPKGAEWEAAVAHWRSLKSDEGAHFDVSVEIDANDIQPTVTWGTSPQDVVHIGGVVPNPEDAPNEARKNGIKRSLEYMALTPGTKMEDVKIDKVSGIGSSASRIADHTLSVLS